MLGFHLSKKLLEKEIKIVGLDNMNDYYDPQLKEDRLAILKEKANFTFYKIDLKDKQDVEQLFEDENLRMSSTWLPRRVCAILSRILMLMSTVI